MKTFIIDIDALTGELFRDLIGFVLSNGINFRKIELVSGDKVGQSLVVEFTSKSEETALKEFLKEQGIASPIILGNGNKATLDGKKLGIFSQVREVSGLPSYWLDRTSGKKFALLQGNV
jgi:hypothetical protein